VTQGSVVVTTLDVPRPKRDGLFIPVGVFDTPGEYQAQIIVTSGQVQETIDIPPLTVHGNLEQAFAAAHAEGHAHYKDSVPFLLETQWKVGLLMESVSRRSMVSSLQVAGEVEAPQSAIAVASAPFAGRLLPPDSGSLPQLGELVTKGQSLGWIQPMLSSSDLAARVANTTSREALALERELRVYDLQTKRTENDQVISQAVVQMRFAKQALERLEVLRAKGLGTIVELETARRDLAVIEGKHESAKQMEKAYVASAEQLEKLKQRMEQQDTGSSGGAAARARLLAPIAGEVVQVEHVSGEYVSDEASIYRVLDLSKVWIAARISEFDLGQIGPKPNAEVRFAALPGERFDVLKSAGGRIVHFGRTVDPESRTVTLRYELPNQEGQLRAGMFADLMIETGRATDAIALPEQAVVMDNGGPVAFVLIHGEMFQKRMLELGIRDRGFVEVLSGIKAGERVVTHGAYLVKLASASPASFGAGHAH
jgi:cobalt-zinc-cadmium efflux system membrane fusion protein